MAKTQRKFKWESHLTSLATPDTDANGGRNSTGRKHARKKPAKQEFTIEMILRIIERIQEL